MGRFRVWRRDDFDDYDQGEREDHAWSVPDRRGILFPENSAPVDDVEEAAELYADHCNACLDGGEWTWPVEFVVHDGVRYFVVEVCCEHVPEFSAGRPMPLDVDAEINLAAGAR